MTMKKTVAAFFVIAVFSFTGGLVGQAVFAPKAADAQAQSDSYFALHDAKNAKGITTYVSDGQPGQVFYGENGQMRLQMGTYNGAGERGLPLLALSDNTGHIRLLFRLAGENESPVMIMKDKSGRDRVVMGLQLGGAEQEPFLSVTDASGKSQNIFGSYR